ncbi:hypothetical protein [Athalassotoga saccharophila]|uniref:hypothetical protein n=1 Tax=Athalassotoga saccharophila TaxID=1441386 RepID=UPI00137A7825|nr:hypothetical protein [Athalassotoga saccharophila]
MSEEGNLKRNTSEELRNIPVTSVERIFGTKKFYTLMTGCCGVRAKKELRNSKKFQN